MLLLAAVLALPTAVAAPSPQAKAEIEKLIATLGESKCSFQRNGSWHQAAEARAHLQRKYDYLLKKDKLDTAEQFIEHAASSSSLSGRAYRVKCVDREQSAAEWFSLQLQRLRGAAAPR